MKKHVFLFCFSCLGLLLSAAVAVANPSPPPQHLTPAMQQSLMQIPPIEGPSLTDQMFENKVVIVTFFATWCIPCRVELKHLNTLYQRYQMHGLEVVAVNYFEDFDGLSNDQKLQRYLKRFPLQFPVIRGTDSLSDQFGKITRIPTLFVFDRQQKRVFRFFNQRGGSQTAMSLRELEQAVLPYLGSP